jgi:hypothetical protein
MNSIFKNLKTSICGFLSIAIAALVSLGTIPPTEGIILAGAVNGVGHLLGADASQTDPMITMVRDHVPEIVGTVRTIADQHATVLDKINEVAKTTTDITNALNNK